MPTNSEHRNLILSDVRSIKLGRRIVEGEKYEGFLIAKSPNLPGPTDLMSGDNLVFYLWIETNTDAVVYGSLRNRFEKADASIVDIVSSPPSFYDKNGSEEIIELTPAQLSKPGFNGDDVTFKNGASHDSPLVSRKQSSGGGCDVNSTMTFHNKTGFFTVQEMIHNIVAFEKMDRPKTKWFGGVDCHHTYYQGLELNEDGKSYEVMWGS